MRITGGHAKGKTLAPFKGLDIRPTPDQVREAIFSIIGQNLTGKIVLDLFAGTGVLGLEALSRGAARALFIDRARRSIGLTRRNIQICGFTDRSLVMMRDLTKGLPPLESLGGQPFDIIFLDPPYRQNMAPKCLSSLVKGKILANGGIVIVETHKTEYLSQELCGLVLVDSRTYGDTRINFYELGAQQ